jgi:hypothetical protein
MWQSLLLKLGMFAATMGVVFWIGWTLPTSFDRARDLAVNSSEGAQSEMPFASGRATAVRGISRRLVGGSASHCSRAETVSPGTPRSEPGDGTGF